MKRIIIILFLLFFILFFLTIPLFSADNNMIFTISDPEGDDYGPGTYQYPRRDIFKEKGLFDIISFEIYDSKKYYRFVFSFKNLTNPWQSRYGFSMPLIQLYIDNQKGGSTEIFEEGANVKLNPKYPWNHLLEISGWWVRHYQPEDRDYKEEPWMLADLEEYTYDVENAVVNKNNNEIIVEVEKELFGQLEGSHIYLIVGSFDAFGRGYFRSIQNAETNWSFYSPENDNLSYAPRVIDIILPDNKKQTEVLASYTAESYAMIYPFKISTGIFSSRKKVYSVIVLSMFLCLVLLIFTMNKFPYYRDNIN